MATVSKGVYVEIDAQTALPVRVVEGSTPERGYVLIAPGTVPGPEDEARVQRARDSIKGVKAPSAPIKNPTKE